MADLRVAVEPQGDGHPTQRIYLNGHALSGVRRVRVSGEWGRRTASLDLALEAVSIDPRTISMIAVVRGSENADITIEADNVNGPVAADMLPGWACGPARAYHRPDTFDRARDLCARLADVDWLYVIGMTYLVITILGVLLEAALLGRAAGPR